MVTWADAHRVANIAAAQAHHDLGVDTSAPPVDVAAALAEAGVLLMWQPMPRLFGAYLNGPGVQAGALVNSGLPIGSRRHTAAHELGHHRLGHRPTVDDESCLEIDVVGTDLPGLPSRRRWSDNEKMAEAFAAWFLLPRRAVLAAMQVRGISRITSCDEVYQLSLILGTSYRSLARHLPNLRLASGENARAWSQESPGRIKSRIDPRGDRAHAVSDVWQLDALLNGAKLIVQVGDLLISRYSDATTESGGAVRLDNIGGPCTSAIKQRAWIAGADPSSTADDYVWLRRPGTTSKDAWSVNVQVQNEPRGLDRNWTNNWGKA